MRIMRKALIDCLRRGEREVIKRVKVKEYEKIDKKEILRTLMKTKEGKYILGCRNYIRIVDYCQCQLLVRLFHIN